MSLPVSDSTLLLCRRTTVDVHVVGETADILEDRQKAANKIVEDFAKTGKLPNEWPQGVEIKVTILHNHGGGGGP